VFRNKKTNWRFFMRTLKLSVLFSLLTFSAFASAAPTVKIDSYTYTAQGVRTAELCGTVSNMTATPTFVRITVDESSKQPAVYNTLAGADGKFCTLVVTYYGTAIATAL
jgi:hypothetical protein